jgi:hypothetical protein
VNVAGDVLDEEPASTPTVRAGGPVKSPGQPEAGDIELLDPWRQARRQRGDARRNQPDRAEERERGREGGAIGLSFRVQGAVMVPPSTT